MRLLRQLRSRRPGRRTAAVCRSARARAPMRTRSNLRRCCAGRPLHIRPCRCSPSPAPCRPCRAPQAMMRKPRRLVVVRTAQIEPIRDSSGDHIRESAGERVFGQLRELRIEFRRQLSEIGAEGRTKVVCGGEIAPCFGAEKRPRCARDTGCAQHSPRRAARAARRAAPATAPARCRSTTPAGSRRPAHRRESRE